MSRKTLVPGLMLSALLGTLALSTGLAPHSVWATTAPANESETLDAKKFFQFQDSYLKAPAQERNLFILTHAVAGDTHTGIKVTLVSEKGQEKPLKIDEEGRILPRPSLEDLSGKTQVRVESPKGSKLHINVVIEPTFAPAKTYSVAQVVATCEQATKTSKARAGLVAALVPTYDTIYFRKAKSGEVVLKDGTSRPLPLTPKGSPYFHTKAFPNAVTIRLEETPSFMALGPAPQKG